MSSIHPDICDRLLSYLDGCLDEDLRREVQAHLERCKPCSKELAAMTAMTHALRHIDHDDPAEAADVERSRCPDAERLILYRVSHRTADDEWIAGHLERCSRCQHEVDLIRLMTLQLSGPSGLVVPQDLSVRIEERLMARVRQGKGGDQRVAVLNRFPFLSVAFLWRAALGVGCAAALAVWGFVQLQSNQVLVAKRSTEGDVPNVRPAPSSPALREQPRPSIPSAATRIEVPATPALEPGLPTLVPAKQGEMLKVLILPTPSGRGLRSAVAAGLGGQIGAAQPPDREFPPEPSIDDLTANRRLGRLFGVRYILEIGVKAQPSGYLVMLRVADTETGGLVAKRQAQISQEKALPTVAGRLAKELRQVLLENR